VIKVNGSQVTYDQIVSRVRGTLTQALNPPRFFSFWRSGSNAAEERTALSTLKVWCELPSPQRVPADASSDLIDVYSKEFRGDADVVRALVGHVRAEKARADEEKLAYQVLANLERYEAFALDPAVINALARLQALNLLATFVENTRTKAYYGFGSRLPSATSAGALFEALQALPELERLYVKVAALHHVCRWHSRDLGLSRTPGRSDHANMRFGKSSLNEDDAQVLADRAAGVSIWAGTSGSAMDMMHLVNDRGLAPAGPPREAIAWCIFAFFHFMPTTASPTHTFHEVMRGALKILGTMQSYSGAAALPTNDFMTAFVRS
jgi:hypothetical protein